MLNWLGFCLVRGISLLLILMYWNSWIFQSPLRFLVGVPLAVLGGLLALWRMIAAGWKNTSGLNDGFVASGPYRFSRKRNGSIGSGFGGFCEGQTTAPDDIDQSRFVNYGLRFVLFA